MLALPLYYLGDWDDAIAEMEVGLALADELDFLGGVRLVASYRGVPAQRQCGDPPRLRFRSALRRRSSDASDRNGASAG
jgi:hypothetical protein